METQLVNLPKHIGFIIDGNRRWAKKHGLPSYEGHLAGHTALREVLRAAVNRGVKYISFYVFSTENWKRSDDEIARLMKLVLSILKDDTKESIKENIQVRVLGTRERLSQKVINAIDEAEQKTANCTRATSLFCFNYGGQLEIANAAQKCADEGVKITPDAIRERLYGADVPDVDLIVRTSGEKRLSNFMLWRAAYSEFLFLDKLWPDMRAEDVDYILREYAARQRRFGGN